MRLTPLDPWIASKVGQDGGRVTRDAIEAYQLQKLRETLCLAREKSVFYRTHLASAPLDLASLADLARFPFTTADQLREQPLQFLCVSQGEIQRVVTLFSSGTTGNPKRLYFTADDQELTVDFFRVGMSTLVDPGDRVLILLPATTPGGVGDLLATALERMGAAGIRHGLVGDVTRTLEVMARERVNSLVGVPTQVLSLVRCRDENGLAGTLRLKSALLTTDHVPRAIVAAVEGAWGCLVFNHYGMTEMGLGGGVECQARLGYHLREADLYVEIVDPETGDPVPDGEVGEVVFTTLTRQGMPLIRYRTGDLSCFFPQPCTCGTVLKTLARVRDRVSGRVRLGNGLGLTMADLDDALFPLETVLDFKATLGQGDARSGWSPREMKKDRLPSASLSHGIFEGVTMTFRTPPGTKSDWLESLSHGIFEGDGPDRLHLDVQVVAGTEAASLPALQDALDSISALRQARKGGCLDVGLSVRPAGERAAPAAGKRVIVTRARREMGF